MKEKITPDQVAMIIADWQHGELMSCNGVDCDNCALNKELPTKIVGNNKVTMCNVITEMSTLLNEVEYD